MWQIEDLIRANALNLDLIEENIVSKYTLEADAHKAMVEWYESLIDMMRRENVTESGHLQINKNVIIQLTDLSNALLKDPRFAQYSAMYYKTLLIIVELRAKAAENAVGDIETCFTALYGYLLMKLQKRKISQETMSAMNQISQFLALLSQYFKLDSEDKLFVDEE